MNYLLAYLLVELLDDVEPDDRLRRLVLRIPDATTRGIARSVLLAPRGQRQEALDAALSDFPECFDEIRGGIEWARKAGPDLLRDTIDKVYPVPAVMNLATAGEDFVRTAWLWRKMIPRGYLTVLAGRPGVGKSNLAISFAASALELDVWPDGSRVNADELEANTRAVCWIDTEGSQPLLHERLTARGIDPAWFQWPLDPKQPENKTPTLSLDQEPHFLLLAQYCEAYRPRLVVVDSLSGAHSGDENSSEMRFMLQRMAELARDCQVAFLLTHHLRKASVVERGAIVADIDRLRGSTAISQFARVVLALDAPNDENPEALRLRPIKNNLAKLLPPVGVTIDEKGVWFSAEAPEEPRKYSTVDEAADFLREFLEHGARLQADVKEAADGRGIPWQAITKAARELNVVKRPKATAGKVGVGAWVWGLNAGAFRPEPAHEPHRADVDG